MNWHWVKEELELHNMPLSFGSKSKADIIKVQEWLNLNNITIKIDGDYGKATERAVRMLQEDCMLIVDGSVTEDVWDILCSDMEKAVEHINPIPFSFRGLLLEHAEKHLTFHPREIGGQNRGPWVRLYMQGNEGTQWAWCNGFVSFMIHQTFKAIGLPTIFPYFFSVDLMVGWAKEHNIFIPNSERDSVKIGDLFVTRHATNANDWVHTGIVTHLEEDVFSSIEGNTNDEGSREGFEMCRRIRSYDNKDFIRMSKADLVHAL